MAHLKRRFRSSSLMISTLLVAATFAVFWQVINHDFLDFDDNLFVTENRVVKTGLNPESIAWAFTTTHGGLWHPFTWLSLMLDSQLYGLDPCGYHLTNLLFHIASTILLFLVFERITGAKWKSGFVAALFALHPLHVESVAWVAERKDVLSAFFWMLTMWTYVRYVEHPGLKRYLPVLLSFCLGLMAKPMIVTLPFVLLLLDYWPLGRLQLGQSVANYYVQYVQSYSEQRPRHLCLILEKIPFFVLSALLCVVIFFAMQHLVGSEISLESSPPTNRIATASVAYTFYIGKMIWPHNLAAFYPHPGTFSVWQIAGVGLLLAGISILVLREARTRPYLLVGWLWYLGTLVPVTGLVGFGLPWIAADRYTYVSLIGLFVAIAWGVPDMLAGWRHARITLGVLAGLLICVLMICTWSQLKHWRNTTSLFEHALAVTEDNWFAHKNLGDAIRCAGRIDEAIFRYQEALRINPDYVEAHYNLGNTLFVQGRVNEAIFQYEEALRIKPDYVRAHYNLGMAFYVRGKIHEAISHYREALRIKPDYVDAHTTLGLALIRHGKIDEAISHYSEALRIDPYNLKARTNLGLALVRQGEIDEAISHYLKALRIKPDYVKAHINLGLALIRQDRVDEAISHYSEALRIKPNFAEAHFYLGLAYLRMGDQSLALKQYELLKTINPDLAKLLLNKIDGSKKNISPKP